MFLDKFHKGGGWESRKLLGIFFCPVLPRTKTAFPHLCGLPKCLCSIHNRTQENIFFRLGLTFYFHLWFSFCLLELWGVRGSLLYLKTYEFKRGPQHTFTFMVLLPRILPLVYEIRVPFRTNHSASARVPTMLLTDKLIWDHFFLPEFPPKSNKNKQNKTK